MAEGVHIGGKWSTPGVPHKGWTCVHVEDLGAPSSICEMCETQAIRYVHYMEHPSYPGQLGCGCVCAGRMEENLQRAELREKTLKNSASRRKRWLSREWRESAKGNPYLNVDGYNVVVFARAGSWSFIVKNRATNRAFAARRGYNSTDAAKLGAFDAMLWMKETGR